MTRQALHQRKRAQLGMCIVCTRLAEPKHARCARCLKRDTERNLARYYASKEKLAA